MENKADVKSIMARFQSGGPNTDETESTVPGRPVYHPRPPGLPMHTKKPVMDNFSGGTLNIPPKPIFPKNTVKRANEANEVNSTKSLAHRFEHSQEDGRTSAKPFGMNKLETPLKPTLSQTTEAKLGPGQKIKPSLSSTLSDSKPAFPKLHPAVTSRPIWAEGGPGSTPPEAPPLQRKPSSGLFKLRTQNEETAGFGADAAAAAVAAAAAAAARPSPPPNPALKPHSNFRTAQNMFNKEAKGEESQSGAKADEVSNVPSAASSTTPTRPTPSKKPSIRIPPKTFLQTSSVNDETASGPRQKPLPSLLVLGAAPAKPRRPPKVDLENFKIGSAYSDDVPSSLKKPIIPPLPASHPSNHSNHTLPPQPPPAVPSLPPRHPGTMIQQEDFYDDIDEFSSAPPPLPPTTGHPSLRAKVQEEKDGDDDNDGEMYEFLDEQWDAAEENKEKRDEKEEKKRQEAEKKEQKEREKKEQDARKKFKLVGPLDAVQQVKTHVDCKGSKTDLAMKQGDCLDIIRVQGNPEGKWLGRTKDGSIGYVKTTSVQIDFSSLKNCAAKQEYVQEVYDDIDVAPPDNSGLKAPGEEGGEVYDDVVDPNLEVRSSAAKPLGFLRMFEWNRRPSGTKVNLPPGQFAADENSVQPGAAFSGEIYDDVDSQPFPPPPPLSSLPTLKGKWGTEELDPKKQKKMEKEEKEFRKKFKYEGEIQVLYQVTINPALTNKKWTGKELSVKAGETLDVIVKAADNKLLCRNEDGKFGYVLMNHIVMDDGDIYDDIGDDCIYDND